MKFTYSLLILLLVTLHGYCADNPTQKETILIISSYNPDTQRMSSFIEDFEKQMVSYRMNYQILIEDMACKNVDDYREWKSTMQVVLDRYKSMSIKAIILLGQEAFTTFVALDEHPNIPFFACFASVNGVDMFNATEHKSVDMIKKAKEIGPCGGLLNRYDVTKNIELIQSLYPSTKNIVFVSDNTYGGLSLGALVDDEVAKFKGLRLINIDSRTMDQQNVPAIISELPENSVLLLGTWRVDRNGMYMINNSIDKITSLNEKIPTFSLTGTGLGSVAMGGYIPKYRTSGKEIANQIRDYYSRGVMPDFIVGEGEYRFDRDMMSRYDIRESHLPKGSIIVDNASLTIKKYRSYVFASLLVICLLVILLTWLYRIIRHNKVLQRELIAAKEHAEESDKLKTAFLANMGHEIRTPLNSIVGFSMLLCEEPFPVDSKKEYCDTIRKNCDMLLRLINDILDISRMEAGKLQFNFNTEDVLSLCRQAMMTTEHLRHSEVEIKFEPDEKSVDIYTDSQRILQILINLLTNAIKFTDNGSITLAYKVDEENNRVLFSISDTGIGIPADMHDKVFNRFEKLNHYKQGTGLGLAICKQISIHLGGDIFIDGSYTHGTRFVFSHPLKIS